MKILITGGAGFAGHHVVEHFLKNTDWEIVILDKLTYASSGFDRLREIEALGNGRLKVLTGNCSEKITEGTAKEIGSPDYILHMAAETHVDRSIENPEPFVKANVLGTFWILEYAKSLSSLEQFIYFSTDEVFGPAPERIDFKEWDCYNTTNPYAATKAGGEELALAYANTYNLPVLIIHCMNLFGERQHPEKFIPKIMRALLEGQLLQIHADPTKTKAGKRKYIHCRNMAAAILFLLQSGQFKRDKVNIVGEKEVDNLDLAQKIAGILDLPLLYEMVDFHSARPGHDLRYSLCGDKLKSLGWEIPKTFEASLAKTVLWTLDNQRWLYGQ